MQEIRRDDNSILHEHEIEAMKMNQEIIKRMAENSLRLKSLFLIFSLSLILLLITEILKVKGELFFVGSVVTLSFWYMDAKYLELERGFREHHKAILSGSLGYLKKFDFNPLRYKVASLSKIMLSESFSLLVYPLMLGMLLFLSLVSFLG